MGLTLNIATMVRARRWLWAGVLIALLVAWIEIILTVASLSARTLVFPVIAFALLIAQFRILGVTRSAFPRISRELWRTYAFIALTLFFFVCASVAIEDPVLPLYFTVLSIALIYPSLKTIRGLKTIGNEIWSVADPTFLNRWLYGGRLAQPKSSVFRSRLPRALPWFIFGACSILSMIAHIVLHELEIVRTAVPVVLYILIAAYSFNRGRRHIKLRVAELRHLDRRDPVLILRSFKDDKLPTEKGISRRLRLKLRPTLEEIVAYEANLLGPSITIGEPGEKLPPLGASREYLLSEDWKTAVRKLIDDASLIIFILGDTDNLFWELSTTISQRGKARLLVVVPPLLKQIDLERRWYRFAEANAALLGTTFPRHLPNKHVVAFFFRQDDPVLIVSQEFGWWDYTLGIRLFLSLYQRKLSSAQDVRGYLLAHVPIVLGQASDNDSLA
ncbi:MAG: hypothetical protein GY784_18645 [Gammaproteobacteria bacterium]|nr:hypothetical protein [Gammaproteobacteria bacterium]